MVNLLDGSWDDTSVLVVIGLTQHSEGFTSAGLTVTHHSSVVPSDGTVHNLGGSLVIDIILGGVMQNGVELEFPVVKLIVDSTHFHLVSVDVKILQKYGQNDNLTILTPVYTLTLRLLEAN